MNLPRLLVASTALIALAGCAHGPTSPSAEANIPMSVGGTPPELPRPSEAKLMALKNSKVNGSFAFTAEKKEVHIVGEIAGLKANTEHGLHIHENGVCALPKFESAGGHWNPQKQPHGGPDSRERHPGDLGNVTSDASGVARVDVRVPQGAGIGTFAGKSIVLHAKMDDLKTQPSGDSGDRIACGVVTELPR